MSVSGLSAELTAYIGDGILILVLLLALFIGSKKGFLGLLVGFLAGIVTIALATMLCSPLAAVIGDNFGLRPTLTNYFNGAFNFSDEIYTTPVKELTAEQISNAIKDLGLPSFLNDAIANLIQSKLAAANIADDVTLQMMIVGGLTNAALTAIAWFALFVVLLIIFSIIKHFVKAFNNVPIIGPLNKLLGALLSLVIAVFIICVLMYLFVLISGSLSESVVNYVKNSVLLKWLYDNNPLAWVLNKLFTK
ncbi:MAG: CvpA family protein [Clostridia bacterium]|nr:CvpA family protein [Clostridia bacterium]